MAKEVVSTSEDGFASTNSIRDFELTIDAEGEETPDTVETLLADYAASRRFASVANNAEPTTSGGSRTPSRAR